jgi:hypothetical protein
VVIAPDDCHQELESFVRERGIAIKFVDTRKLVDRPVAFSLGFFKAYAVNLKKTVKSNIIIDLLPAKIKAKGQERSGAGSGSALFGFKLDVRFILLAFAIIGIPFGLNYYRMQPVLSALNSVTGSRPQVRAIKSDLSLEELKSTNAKYRDSIRAITGILKKRIFITGQLDTIPRIVSDGLWLRDFNFRKSDNDFVMTIHGSCYLVDPDKERDAITKFKNSLKANPNFSKFNSIDCTSMERGQLGKVSLTNFVIECRS